MNNDINDDWVSQLHFNDEGVNAIMRGLARKLNEASFLRDGLGHSVELKFPFDLSELDNEFAYLVLVTPVPTRPATPFGGIILGFCPLGYRRFAEAAKDRVRSTIDRDGCCVI